MDRGTERGASIRKKLEQYQAFDATDGFWREFKHDWFRALFVCTDETRANALLKLFPSEIFWVTNAETMLQRDLLFPYWRSRECQELALHVGPNPTQLERIEKRKRDSIVAAPPMPPKVNPVQKKPASLVNPVLFEAPKKPEPQKQPFNWKPVLHAVYGICATVFIAAIAWHTYRTMSAHVEYSDDQQVVYPDPHTGTSSSWGIAAVIVGSLIAAAIVKGW